MISASTKAQRLLDELAANGGAITPQTLEQDGLPRFLLDVRGGGDRTRCRQLATELKADAVVLRAALAIVERGRAA